MRWAGGTRKGYDLLRPGGLLLAFGFANMNTGGRRRVLHIAGEWARMPRHSPLKMLDDNRGIAGVNLGHLWSEVELMRGAAERVLALLDEGRITPHIHATFPFERVADAHRALEYGDNLGKVVLVP